MNDNKLWEIAEDILQELYANSTPQLDFKDFKARVDAGEKHSKDWYSEYEIFEKKYNEIIDRICRERKVKHKDKNRICMSVLLNWGPKFSKDVE